MSSLADRAYFVLCRALGLLLRSTRYSSIRVVVENGRLLIRKRRVSYASFLIRLGGPLMRILNTGVRVLAQPDWEERERLLCRSLRRASLRIDGDGTLVFPFVAGKSLAALLDDSQLPAPLRDTAIELAVVALAELHRLRFTHGDARAGNVVVNLNAGAAYWVDFETVHDSNRPVTWRQADDVRALLATCLLRTVAAERADVVRLILEVYADDQVAGVLASSFTSVRRRALTFHLAQAALSFECFQEMGRLLREIHVQDLDPNHPHADPRRHRIAPHVHRRPASLHHQHGDAAPPRSTARSVDGGVKAIARMG